MLFPAGAALDRGVSTNGAELLLKELFPFGLRSRLLSGRDDGGAVWPDGVPVTFPKPDPDRLEAELGELASPLGFSRRGSSLREPLSVNAAPPNFAEEAADGVRLLVELLGGGESPLLDERLNPLLGDFAELLLDAEPLLDNENEPPLSPPRSGFSAPDDGTD